MKTLYKIEDYSGNVINLLADDKNEFKAKSNIDAVRKYLTNKGIKAKPIRSGDDDVQIKVTPFYIAENGLKYFHPTKKISWYRLEFIN